jgi:hypothetical protein
LRQTRHGREGGHPRQVRSVYAGDIFFCGLSLMLPTTHLTTADILHLSWMAAFAAMTGDGCDPRSLIRHL